MYFFILLGLFRTYTHGEPRLGPFGTYTRSSSHYHTIDGVPEIYWLGFGVGLGLGSRV